MRGPFGEFGDFSAPPPAPFLARAQADEKLVSLSKTVKVPDPPEKLCPHPMATMGSHGYTWSYFMLISLNQLACRHM